MKKRYFFNYCADLIHGKKDSHANIVKNAGRAKKTHQ